MAQNSCNCENCRYYNKEGVGQSFHQPNYLENYFEQSPVSVYNNNESYSGQISPAFYSNPNQEFYEYQTQQQQQQQQQYSSSYSCPYPYSHPESNDEIDHPKYSDEVINNYQEQGWGDLFDGWIFSMGQLLLEEFPDPSLQYDHDQKHTNNPGTQIEDQGQQEMQNVNQYWPTEAGNHVPVIVRPKKKKRENWCDQSSVVYISAVRE